MLTFVDANVFVRLFVEDDAKQIDQASALFERAKNNEIDLITGPPVFLKWLPVTFSVTTNSFATIMPPCY